MFRTTKNRVKVRKGVGWGHRDTPVPGKGGGGTRKMVDKREEAGKCPAAINSK